MTREEYDILIAESSARGEAWREAEELALTKLREAIGSDADELRDMDDAEARALVGDLGEAVGGRWGASEGVEVERLRPGMAVDGFEGMRKKGWDEGRVLGDWTRVVKAG
jgi:hypothetical protein